MVIQAEDALGSKAANHELNRFTVIQSLILYRKFRKSIILNWNPNEIHAHRVNRILTVLYLSQRETNKYIADAVVSIYIREKRKKNGILKASQKHGEKYKRETFLWNDVPMYISIPFELQETVSVKLQYICMYHCRMLHFHQHHHFSALTLFLLSQLQHLNDCATPHPPNIFIVPDGENSTAWTNVTHMVIDFHNWNLLLNLSRVLERGWYTAVSFVFPTIFLSYFLFPYTFIHIENKKSDYIEKNIRNSVNNRIRWANDINR